jgi:nitrite reductase/ring-hydroxylating ferredoxin subunit
VHTEEQARGAFGADDWFPVELSHHVREGQVVQSMLHGQELALWRPLAGSVQAWENRCPHRSVRLTLGFVDGEQLICRYHGWRYGSDGRCTGVPSTPALAPPPAACVRTYMCREADGVVWASLALAPRGYPPRLPDLAACRSFTLDIAAEALVEAIKAAGFESDGCPVVWRESGHDPEAGTLLLQPMDARTTCVHLFIAGPLSTAHRVVAAQRMKALFAEELSHA